MAPRMQTTPTYTAYAEIAPNPADFPALLDRIGDHLRQPFDWRNDVQALAMPVMLIYGDNGHGPYGSCCGSLQIAERWSATCWFHA